MSTMQRMHFYTDKVERTSKTVLLAILDFPNNTKRNTVVIPEITHPHEVVIELRRMADWIEANERQ